MSLLGQESGVGRLLARKGKSGVGRWSAGADVWVRPTRKRGQPLSISAGYGKFVLVSQRCQKKLPQTWWLEPMKLCSLTVLPHSPWSYKLSQRFRGGAFFPLPASDGSGCFLACGHIILVSGSIFMWPSPLCHHDSNLLFFHTDTCHWI
jgi:hypothetical protein